MSDTHDTMHAYGRALELASEAYRDALKTLEERMEYVERLEFDSSGRTPRRLRSQYLAYVAAQHKFLRADEAFKVASQLLVERRVA